MKRWYDWWLHFFVHLEDLGNNYGGGPVTYYHCRVCGYLTHMRGKFQVIAAEDLQPGVEE